MKILRKGKTADVGLLLEGTFPYVSGGVSSWVNQIIRGFPDITFAICFMGSREEDYGGMRYELPDNVVHLEAHYLHAPRKATAVAARSGNRRAFADIRALHEHYRQPAPGSAPLLATVLEHVCKGRYGENEFLHGRDAWDYITEQYRGRCTDPSFVDYFWTVRTMHAPLWDLVRIMEAFIPCRVYHSVSTGYAGFLGALLKQHTGRPLILSEHGIYTKERKIDLFQAQWIADNRNSLERNPAEVAYFRQLWVSFFEALGRECYASADNIIALYEANRQRQISDGAPPERTRCIPNGVNLAHLETLYAQRAKQMPRVVCLIGRVVPIKDVKTFIRAMRSVASRLDDVEAWIAGPEEEDPAYARDCRHLVDSLGLADRVRFLGFQKIDHILPKAGLLALSSISEALPLVILEGFAAGVPCVATDVGSCRQLLEGMGPEDRALGTAGEVVGIADPEALAAAMVRLLSDPARWQAAQRAGRERVRQFYTQEKMLALYQETYASGFDLADRQDHSARVPAWRRLWRA
jgi:glycosyltransferase involved in cell wall biosynthesis